MTKKLYSLLFIGDVIYCFDIFMEMGFDVEIEGFKTKSQKFLDVMALYFNLIFNEIVCL